MMSLLKSFLAQFLTKENVDRVAERIKFAGYRVVDIAVLWMAQYVLGILDQPDVLVVGGNPSAPGANLTSPLILAAIVALRILFSPK